VCARARACVRKNMKFDFYWHGGENEQPVTDKQPVKKLTISCFYHLQKVSDRKLESDIKNLTLTVTDKQTRNQNRVSQKSLSILKINEN
jgi:hypothetical protein